MPRYDATRFDPPAPLAWVTLRSLEGQEEITQIPMLLDTGADISLVPTQAAHRLNLLETQDEAFKLQGFDGSESIASPVRLELLFSDRSFRGRFLLIDQECGILGRNILNVLRILYDGPRQTWQIAGSST